MPPRPGLRTMGIPLQVTPDDYEFRACIDEEPRIMQRIYRVRMTRPGRVTLSKFKLSGDDDVFSAFSASSVSLEDGQSTILEVLFQPTEVQQYNAKLTFKAVLKRQHGTVVVRTPIARLQGDGQLCAEAPGEGPGNDGGGGDTDTTDTDTGTDIDGGGWSAGSEPPTDYDGPITTLCIRFWKLPDCPDIDNDRLDEWILETNATYGGSGVRFERSAKPVEPSVTPGKQVDPHCIDVYLGGPDHFPGAVAGKTQMSGKDADKDVIDDAGVHEDFLDASEGLGKSITLEVSDASSDSLAHELGHFLGLGPAPDPDATPQEHIDPTDGKPITDDGRLMNPQGPGSKLTDRERRIARAAATKLADEMKRCDETGFYFDPPEESETAYAFHHFGMISQRDHLELIGFATDAFAVASVPLRLDVQVRLPRQEERPWTANYDWNGRFWRMKSTAPASADASALSQPGFLSELAPNTAGGGTRMKTGIVVDIPKNHFGIELGPVEVRSRVGLPGNWQAFPDSGWQLIDLTPPGFVVDLDRRSRSVCATVGGRITLRGTAWQTSTYSGQVELSLSLPDRCERLNLPLMRLPTPLASTWHAQVELPSDIGVGRHAALLEATCSECGTRTSRNLILRVDEA